MSIAKEIGFQCVSLVSTLCSPCFSSHYSLIKAVFSSLLNEPRGPWGMKQGLGDLGCPVPFRSDQSLEKTSGSLAWTPCFHSSPCCLALSERAVSLRAAGSKVLPFLGGDCLLERNRLGFTCQTPSTGWRMLEYDRVLGRLHQGWKVFRANPSALVWRFSAKWRLRSLHFLILRLYYTVLASL